MKITKKEKLHTISILQAIVEDFSQVHPVYGLGIQLDFVLREAARKIMNPKYEWANRQKEE